MSTYVYVCMYIYTSIYIYVYAYMYVCMYVYVRYEYMYVCMHVYMPRRCGGGGRMARRRLEDGAVSGWCGGGWMAERASGTATTSPPASP